MATTVNIEWKRTAACDVRICIENSAKLLFLYAPLGSRQVYIKHYGVVAWSICIHSPKGAIQKL